MNKQPSTLAIGLFVIGALLILIATAVFVSRGGFGSDREKALLVFDGNVKGLNIGAPVAFKGVQIGQVTGIELILDTNTYTVVMPVEIEISDRRIRKIGPNQDEDSLEHLIRNGMRGQLQLQSLLTGLLYVQLDLHPNTEERYADVESDLLQLPTIPTDLEKLSRNLAELDLKSMLDNLHSAIIEINELMSDPALDEIPGNINLALEEIEQLSRVLRGEVEVASPGLRRLIEHTDEAVQQFSTELPILSQSAQASLAGLPAAISSFEDTMGTLDYTLSDDSATMYEVKKAAGDLAGAGRALQALAESLEKQPEALLRGRSKQE
ncbi:MAG: MlaD family protein [Gammaproteobacteria bacterium]|nr:MlaD family protein [Gammaproteobacteria bacterium]